MKMQQRETLGSRLGFLLLSAGCAIGLGNVWRFPYITGEYGGAIFVLIYLGFLLFMGLPILVMEFAVGRASRRNMGLAFKTLEPKGTHWHKLGWWGMAGSYMLMMFYTTVSGWMLWYCWGMISGSLMGLTPPQVGEYFGNMLSQPLGMTAWMTVVVLVGSGVCAMGLRNGVERVVKLMMVGLLGILMVLVVRAVTLPGAGEGIAFYLMPDMSKITKSGLGIVLNAAMNQAFFTLSLGIGCMSIFGSYLEKQRSLTGEALYIAGLDTFVALMSGLIIFPACFAFGVHPNSGPGLVFVTLPNIFNAMPGGQVWGALFFVFMSFAALSTVIAVFENIISYCVDVYGMPRRRATVVNGLLIWLLSFPCLLGFNEWSGFQPLGKGTGILDLEDFIVSGHLLPLGSVIFLIFCCYKRGWGWNNFLAEADQGEGLKFPRWLRGYLTYVLPAVVLFVFVQGYVKLFGG